MVSSTPANNGSVIVMEAFTIGLQGVNVRVNCLVITFL